MWRGDQQGLFGFGYAITIPEIPASVSGSLPVDIPIGGGIGNTVIESFTIPEIPVGAEVKQVDIKVSGNIGPETFPAITIVGPTIAGWWAARPLCLVWT